MRGKKNNTNQASTTTTKTRKRRTLAERIQSFDLQKLTALKLQAEQTIRTIAAEGLRREEAHRALRDVSILDTNTGRVPNTPVQNTAAPASEPTPTKSSSAPFAVANGSV